MRRTGSIVVGLTLIVAGSFFLLVSLFPDLGDLLDIERHWPIVIVAVGLLFVAGALLGSPSLAVPGAVVGGIGTMLYFQNYFDAWESWAYSWTLVPGFVALGVILRSGLRGELNRGWRNAGPLLIFSLVMFAVFAVLFGGIVRFSVVWPVLLIAAGAWMLIRNLIGRRR